MANSFTIFAFPFTVARIQLQCTPEVARQRLRAGILRQAEVVNPFHYFRDRGKLYGIIGRSYFSVGRLQHQAPWMPTILGRISEEPRGSEVGLLFMYLLPTAALIMTVLFLGWFVSLLLTLRGILGILMMVVFYATWWPRYYREVQRTFRELRDVLTEEGDSGVPC